jgi:hypothetical protein
MYSVYFIIRKRHRNLRMGWNSYIYLNLFKVNCTSIWIIGENDIN